ncbi:BRO family protein [Brucella sp. 10RB9215]|nr:BRO family protein [Brucella sp. 10RB9215]
MTKKNATAAMTKSADALTEIFNFMDRKVRVVILKGDPWFVAVDLYDILFGKRSGLQTRRIVGAGEMMKVRRDASDYYSLTNLFGHKQVHLALISEAGLYKLILKSRKPEAKKFQNWVTQVVLPAIRKDGMYVRGEEKVSAGEMDLEELTLITLTRLQEKMKRLKEEKEAAEALAKFSQGIITEHLDYVTMDEGRALSHLYLPHGMKTKLSRKAAVLCRERGIEVKKQTRELNVGSNHITAHINVYPKGILDEVWGGETFNTKVAA